MSAKSSDYLTLIKQASILDSHQTDDLDRRFARGEHSEDSRQFARKLVDDGILTGYQSEMLFMNRGKELRFDRYVILDMIGQGAMGEVFKARHKVMDRIVALKTILPEVAAKPRSILRFNREIRMMALLDHPNIIRAYDAEANAQHFFLIMEYFDGFTIHEYMQSKGPLRPGRAVDFTIKAARGLHHAHLQGAIHRDVKPSNLMVNSRKDLKILDFGLGVLLDDPSNITRPDQTVGTVDFMSPEQAMGAEVTGKRSDQFSLGCTLYFMLTGQFAFPGENKITRLGKRLSMPPHPIQELRPELPSPLVNILEKMLATDPKKRFPDCDSVADELQKLLRRSNQNDQLVESSIIEINGSPSSSGIAQSPSFGGAAADPSLGGSMPGFVIPNTNVSISLGVSPDNTNPSPNPVSQDQSEEPRLASNQPEAINPAWVLKLFGSSMLAWIAFITWSVLLVFVGAVLSKWLAK